VDVRGVLLLIDWSDGSSIQASLLGVGFVDVNRSIVVVGLTLLQQPIDATVPTDYF
jgi:hypothetical protein